MKSQEDEDDVMKEMQTLSIKPESKESKSKA